MENNENKKAPEALPDEALDAVTGGVSPFVKNNCYFCRHCETDCPYGTPLDAYLELGGVSQCPSKEA